MTGGEEILPSLIGVQNTIFDIEEIVWDLDKKNVEQLLPDTVGQIVEEQETPVIELGKG